MSQTTHQDFGLFRMELLNVDYITFNLTKLFESDIEELATYFQNLGFKSFRKAKETNQSCQKIYTSNYSKKEFQVHFILAVPYQKSIQCQKKIQELLDDIINAKPDRLQKTIN